MHDGVQPRAVDKRERRSRLTMLQLAEAAKLARRLRDRSRSGAARRRPRPDYPGRSVCARICEFAMDRSVQCRERLGGLLRYYHQEAA